jgi:hypothetical protein
MKVVCTVVHMVLCVIMLPAVITTNILKIQDYSVKKRTVTHACLIMLIMMHSVMYSSSMSALPSHVQKCGLYFLQFTHSNVTLHCKICKVCVSYIF